MLVFRFFVMIFFFSFSCCFASSNDVVYGNDMADPSIVVEKEKSITFAPHAEIEYRYESIEIGEGSSGAMYPALAVGIAAKHGNNILDLYTRFPLVDNPKDSDYVDLEENYIYGVQYSRLFGSGGSLMYASLALEYREFEIYEDFSDDRKRDEYSKKSFSLRPGVGLASIRGNFSNVVGGGLIFDYGTVEADYYSTFDRKRYNDDGTTFGVGVFVQNKAAYHVTEHLSIPFSIYADMLTSLNDPDVEGSQDTLSSYYFSFGAKIGIQYLF